MELLRAIVGMVIGAAIGIAGVNWIELAVGAELGWLNLLIGIVVGLGAWVAAGAGSSRSHFRGGLALVVCLASFIVGPQILSKVTTRHPGSGKTSKVETPSESVANPQNDVPMEAGPDMASASPSSAPVADSLPPAVIPAEPDLSPLDIAGMVGAAAVAYFIGAAGRSKKNEAAPPATADTTPDPDPEATP